MRTCNAHTICRLDILNARHLLAHAKWGLARNIRVCILDTATSTRGFDTLLITFFLLRIFSIRYLGCVYVHTSNVCVFLDIQQAYSFVRGGFTIIITKQRAYTVRLVFDAMCISFNTHTSPEYAK